jgi:hypothetical protein
LTAGKALVLKIRLKTRRKTVTKTTANLIHQGFLEKRVKYAVKVCKNAGGNYAAEI